MWFFTRNLGRTLLLTAVVAIGAVLLSGCGGDSGANSGGGAYDYVMIGGKKWMKKNLNVVTADSWCYGEDGDIWKGWDDDSERVILQTLSPSEIQANCNTYGRLYTWWAAKAACQSVGWRLPTRGDWDALVAEAGGWETAAGKLKSRDGWYDNGNGTDNYGFMAIPGGFGSPDVFFIGVGYTGLWWTATEGDGDYADHIMMFMDTDSVYNGSNSEMMCFEDSPNKDCGASVRCVAN